jgi:hypothetical protein
MKPVAAFAVTLALLASAGLSQAAWAQSKQTKQTEITGLAPVTVSDSYISEQTTTLSKPEQKSNIFQFDLKGKWGLKFDVNQAESRPSGFNDVDAGAFYKLTPSLRVGGTVGFGEKTEAFKPETTGRNQNAKTQPRVRLETTFKF